MIKIDNSKNEDFEQKIEQNQEQNQVQNQVQNKDTTQKRKKWIEQENANDVGELLTRKARGEDITQTLHRLAEFLTELADESSEERKKHRAELGNTADTDQDSDDQ